MRRISRLSPSRPFWRRLALTTVVLGGLAALPAAGAQAALTSTTGCATGTLTEPFAQWGDTNSYELASGGDFSTGAPGWTLTGGASVAGVGIPYAVPGAAGSSSLYLPKGASAQSPLACVDAAEPTFRFFAENSTALSSVTVQVVYTEPLVGVVALPVGIVIGDSSWKPTSAMSTLAALAAVFTGGTAQVALRFTATTGASHIGDVFVDPRVYRH